MIDHHVNWKELKEFAEDLQIDLAELFEIYFDQAEANIAIIQEKLIERDLVTIVQKAHLMISSTGSLMLIKLEALFREVHSYANKNEIDSLAIAVEALGQELLLVKEEVHNYL